MTGILKGFRQLAREAEARKEFPCGHAMTKENTVIQFHGKHIKQCRKCFQDRIDERTRANRALRDKQDPDWRAKRQDANRKIDAAYRRKRKVVRK